MRLVNLLADMIYYGPDELPDAPGGEVRALGPDRCLNLRICELWYETDMGQATKNRYTVWHFTRLAKILRNQLCE